MAVLLLLTAKTPAPPPAHRIWMNALASGLQIASQKESKSTTDSSLWAQALQHALSTLQQYTPARLPSRTLIDPLEAFTSSFTSSQGSDLPGAIEDARKAAENTKNLEAKAGRAVYVDQKGLMEANVPDPGAWGVAKILDGFERASQGNK